MDNIGNIILHTLLIIDIKNTKLFMIESHHQVYTEWYTN